MDKVISLQKQGKCNMRKLKRISDGKVFDCTIILDGSIMCCIFFENGTWYQDRLCHFIPAEPGKDY